MSKQRKTQLRVSWTKTKKASLLGELAKLYPEPESELNFKNDFQLIISVMLSAQCTDKKVNDVTPQLFQEYPNFKRLGEAKVQDIEKIIRQVNYYKTKSKNIIATSKIISMKYRGQLPKTQATLMELPGVGQKTANVVLSEKGFAPALPVDTHVFRLSRRLGLSDEQTPHGVEESLKAHFDPEHWRALHHQLILHGRKTCKAQRPLCEECSLSSLCPSQKMEKYTRNIS